MHPDLYLPEIPGRSATPEPPPVWESREEIAALVRYCTILYCNVLY